MTTIGEIREQERVQDLCLAVIRALSGEPRLHFRANRLHHAHAPVLAEAPHLHADPGDDFGSHRGIADGLAMRLRHSDPELHRALAPEDPVAHLVFELLEQFRVESRMPAVLAGARRNLRHRHVAWSRAFHASGLTETERGMLIYTVAQICRSRVVREPVVEETEDLLEGTRFRLAPVIGADLAALRAACEDQAAYAVPARRLAEKVADLVRGDDVDAEGERHWSRRGGFSLWVPPARTDDEADEGGTAAGDRPGGDAHGYRVFTRAHDRVVDVRELVRRPQLLDYREQLDERIREHGVNVSRLARALRALLTTPEPSGWDSAQEEGHIDGRRLTQLIASPTERRFFRTRREQPEPDSLVTFLVDCSGSMRRHHEKVAIVVDVFARALDLAGVSSEVLGFTTGAWNGGRPLRDWRRAGRPPRPGRLNEVSHLVFKAADTPWRTARPALAAFLREDLYREGVDGEAVAWAASRMKARPEARRLLVVVSDGSPSDSATALANGASYLDSHLAEVIAREEAEGAVQVHGLGVGPDLSRWYSRRHALDLDLDLEHRVFAEIVSLLAAGTRR